jgi:hypothetical protein
MMRIFVTIMILAAIVVGFLATVLDPDRLATLIKFRLFFEVTWPILGVGALIKYLCTCPPKCCKGCNCQK